MGESAGARMMFVCVLDCEVCCVGAGVGVNPSLSGPPLTTFIVVVVNMQINAKINSNFDNIKFGQVYFKMQFKFGKKAIKKMSGGSVDQTQQVRQWIAELRSLMSERQIPSVISQSATSNANQNNHHSNNSTSNSPSLNNTNHGKSLVSKFSIFDSLLFSNESFSS